MASKIALLAALILSASFAAAEQKDLCKGIAGHSDRIVGSAQKSAVDGAQVAGDVCLLVTISDSGTVQNVQLLRGFNKEADKKAIKAVRHWKFDPAKKDGRPVAVKVAVLVTVWRGPDGSLLIESWEKKRE